jgi:wyosine [tRNA(Phe)-imidazoG37] synthetase (radical SAM superfamily)
MIEIYFDNVCNMSCIYCWDGFSSKIQQENIKLTEENKELKHKLDIKEESLKNALEQVKMYQEQNEKLNNSDSDGNN